MFLNALCVRRKVQIFFRLLLCLAYSGFIIAKEDRDSLVMHLMNLFLLVLHRPSRRQLLLYWFLKATSWCGTSTRGHIFNPSLLIKLLLKSVDDTCFRLWLLVKPTWNRHSRLNFCLNMRVALLSHGSGLALGLVDRAGATLKRHACLGIRKAWRGQTHLLPVRIHLLTIQDCSVLQQLSKRLQIN